MNLQRYFGLQSSLLSHIDPNYLDTSVKHRWKGRITVHCPEHFEGINFSLKEKGFSIWELLGRRNLVYKTVWSAWMLTEHGQNLILHSKLETFWKKNYIWFIILSEHCEPHKFLLWIRKLWSLVTLLAYSVSVLRQLTSKSRPTCKSRIRHRKKLYRSRILEC